VSRSVSSPNPNSGSRRRAGGGAGPADATTGLPPLPADAAVPPPWGTSFDVRESLDAMRAAAVKRHLATIGPGQARSLRRARQRSLVTGLLGGGVAMLALWLASIALRGNGPPAATVAHAPAMPVTAVAEQAAPPAAPAVHLAEAARSEPAAVPQSMPAAVAAASLAVPAFADASPRPAAAGVEKPAVAAARPARPAPPRLIASRGDFRPAGNVAEDAGDEAPEDGAFDGWPRPSAAAYLPPDTPFELPTHTRLSDG